MSGQQVENAAWSRVSARSTTATQPAAQQGSESPGPVAELVREIRSSRRGTVCGIVVLVLIVMALFAPVIAPYDPLAADFRGTFRPPSVTHLLGTDELG